MRICRLAQIICCEILLWIHWQQISDSPIDDRSSEKLLIKNFSLLWSAHTSLVTPCDTLKFFLDSTYKTLAFCRSKHQKFKQRYQNTKWIASQSFQKHFSLLPLWLGLICINFLTCIAWSTTIPCRSSSAQAWMSIIILQMVVHGIDSLVIKFSSPNIATKMVTLIQPLSLAPLVTVQTSNHLVPKMILKDSKLCGPWSRQQKENEIINETLNTNDLLDSIDSNCTYFELVRLFILDLPLNLKNRQFLLIL